MPTLDDTTTLVKNVAIAANDSLVISNKDSSGSSLIQQVPAAQIVGGYSHAWLFNFDSPSYAVNSDNAIVDLHTFTATQFVNKAAVIVTEGFNPSGTAVIDVGVNDGNDDAYINNLSIKAITVVNNTGADIDTGAASTAFAVDNPTDGDTLAAEFTNGSSQNLSTATTGQLIVLVNIIDTAEYVDLIPAQ